MKPKIIKHMNMLFNHNLGVTSVEKNIEDIFWSIKNNVLAESSPKRKRSNDENSS